MTPLTRIPTALMCSFLLLCLALRPGGASGQVRHAKRVHAVGINPVKLAMGLANVEYELRAGSHTGLHIFGEYRILPWLDHPDLVVRGGVQYYATPTDRELRNAFAALYSGLSWWRHRVNTDEGAFVGAAPGHRFVFRERFFIAPRLVLHYLIGQGKLLWGIEAPVGLVF